MYRISDSETVKKIKNRFASAGIAIRCRKYTGSMKEFYALRKDRGEGFSPQEIESILPILEELEAYDVLGQKITVAYNRRLLVSGYKCYTIDFKLRGDNKIFSEN